MALFHSTTFTSLCLFSNPRRTFSSSLVPKTTSHAHTSSNISRPVVLDKRIKRRLGRECCAALVEGVQEKQAQIPVEDEQDAVSNEKYDWKEEWYPLYLTKEVPDDAPLGLTVFNKQLVLYRDGNGVLRCHEDRCPHRLAKLSEGQLVDGRLECLYHGWQFEGDGQCVKIPQLEEGATIPRAACAKKYHIKDSQGVVWVWMSDKNPPNTWKIPWFEHYAMPGFTDLSSIHELPYDHSILLENLMDPAHVPISHDRTDWTAKREDAQPLGFTVLERTSRGFSGNWWRSKSPETVNTLRFQAPCVLSNNLEITDKQGIKQCFSALFLCRPSGQGKSMLIVRFGATMRSPLINIFPKWYLHQNACKVFEQDMGFLSSQNEVLMKEKSPTKDLYLNLRSIDGWVVEYRKWMDRVGHGMPYYFGHSTVRMPEEPAVVEHMPAGMVAGVAAAPPTKGGVGEAAIGNPANRYYRHVVHCKGCRVAVRRFEGWRKGLVMAGVVAAAMAVLVNGRQWKAALLLAAAVLLGGASACSVALALLTTNFVRTHRRL